MALTAVTLRTEAYADGLLVVNEAITRTAKAYRPAGAGGLPATSARLVGQARLCLPCSACLPGSGPVCTKCLNLLSF